MIFTFKEFQDAWDKKKAVDANQFRKNAPSISDLTKVRVKGVSRSVKSMTVRFEGMLNALDDEDDVQNLNAAIVSWTKKFAAVQVVRGPEDSLTLRLSMTDDGALALHEAVVKTFKGSHGKIVQGWKCIGGPKDGKKVQDPNVCMRPPEYNRRVGAKKGQQRAKGKIAISKRITAIRDKVRRRRLNKANARLKKARGF